MPCERYSKRSQIKRDTVRATAYTALIGTSVRKMAAEGGQVKDKTTVNGEEACSWLTQGNIIGVNGLGHCRSYRRETRREQTRDQMGDQRRETRRETRLRPDERGDEGREIRRETR